MAAAPVSPFYLPLAIKMGKVSQLSVQILSRDPPPLSPALCEVLWEMRFQGHSTHLFDRNWRRTKGEPTWSCKSRIVTQLFICCSFKIVWGGRVHETDKRGARCCCWGSFRDAHPWAIKRATSESCIIKTKWNAIKRSFLEFSLFDSDSKEFFPWKHWWAGRRGF